MKTPNPLDILFNWLHVYSKFIYVRPSTFSGRMSSKSDFFLLLRTNASRYMWKLFDLRKKKRKNHSSRRPNCSAKFLPHAFKEQNEIKLKMERRQQELRVVYLCDLCIIYASSISMILIHSYNDLLSVTRIHFSNTFLFAIRSLF